MHASVILKNKRNRHFAFVKKFIIIQITFLLFLTLGCSSEQKIPGEIHIDKFRYIIPAEYQDITEYEGFDEISTFYDISELLNRKNPKGIYNKSTGTVIVFDYYKNIKYNNFYSLLYYQINVLKDETKLNEIYDKCIPSYVKQLLKYQFSDIKATAEYTIFDIKMEIAFVEVDQIICWQNKESIPEENRLIVVGICKPGEKNKTVETIKKIIK